jgi:hypothetical protein
MNVKFFKKIILLRLQLKYLLEFTLKTFINFIFNLSL